ncbi:organic cation transporter protein-like [Panulirus ornatus]|uniref:organic cation transporter protein-like n=1 Tax=Panulirus ornatus TaxID=150431 RepID=UPI003A83F5D2
MITQLDQVLTHLGTGAWNILTFSLICYNAFLLVPHSLGAAFLAPRVDFVCRDAEILEVTASATRNNLTSDSLVLQDQCSYVVNQTTVKCTTWDFDNSTFASTVTSEYQLVCDREYLRALYQSIYMFGIFSGAFFSSYSCDKFGRKIVIVVGVLLCIVLTLSSCWLPTLSLILISRYFVGTINSLIHSASFVMAMELAEPRVRTVLGFIVGVMWALGIPAWTGLAYLLREWRLLQFVASLPGLLMLPLIMFIDESPRWLMVQGRHSEALKVLRRASRLNKVPLPPEDELLQMMANMVPPEEGASSTTSTVTSTILKSLREITILVRTPRLRAITVILCLDFIILALVYYGLSLSGGSLSNDPFVYMVLTGLMEIPAYTLTIPIVMRFGRRLPSVVSFMTSGFMLIFMALTPAAYGWVVMTFAMVGKVTISAAFQIIIIYCNELYPTEVRSRGFGTSFMMSRIGSIVSPFIIDLLGRRHPWVPSVLFGVVSLVAGASTLNLPETKGTTMIDTIAQFEAPSEKSPSRSYWLNIKRKMSRVHSKSGYVSKDNSPTCDSLKGDH